VLELTKQISDRPLTDPELCAPRIKSIAWREKKANIYV